MPILIGAAIILLILALAFASMAIAIYNGLVSLRQQVDRAWANIDVILKQRFDEIPQIVQILEQYVGYEQSVLKNLAEARKHYGAASSVEDKIKSSSELSMAFRGVLAI